MKNKSLCCSAYPKARNDGARGQVSFSFAWLFAIIVGVVIITIAIYAVVKIIDLGDSEVSAKTGKEIGVLINPLEMGFEGELRPPSFTLPVESRIYLDCNNFGTFGEQEIKIAQKSFNKWSETDLEITFLNKYIVGQEIIQGKEFFMFSKPFKVGFKVSDIIYLLSTKEKYCFNSVPEEVKDYLDFLDKSNILYENCSDELEFIQICFSNSGNCEIVVDESSGTVSKNGTRVYYEGDNLMYAAIFSNPDYYECMVKRLMQKTVVLSEIYLDKAQFVAREGCNSELIALNTGVTPGANLEDLKRSASNIVSGGSSGSLEQFFNIVNEIEDKTVISSCKLW